MDNNNNNQQYIPPPNAFPPQLQPGVPSFEMPPGGFPPQVGGLPMGAFPPQVQPGMSFSGMPAPGGFPPQMGGFAPPMGPPMVVEPSYIQRQAHLLQLNKGEEVDVPWGSNLQLGLAWDLEGQAVDLDASAVLFDNYGVLLDAVFFNQQQTKDKSMIHSGDNKNGLGEGDDESITIISSLIHPSVRAIAVVVNAFKGGDFTVVRSARVILRDLSHNVDVVNVNLPHCSGKHHGLVLALIYRNDSGQWRIRNTYKKAKGKNFKESEYKIRQVLRQIIPEETLIRNWDYSNGSFNLEKNQTFVIPDLQRLTFGLGWDCGESSGIDLDGSVVGFSVDGNLDDDHTIYFGHKSSSNSSIVHSGDNLTGAGEGDDEQLNVQLPKIPNRIHSLFFTVSIYTLNKTFTEVKNAYVRMLNADNQSEICRFVLRDCGDSNAVILAKVFREGEEWRLEAVGDSATARTWRELVPRIKQDYLKGGSISREPPKPHTKHLEIVVIEGRNLAAMDRGGTSDPYVSITTDKNAKFKTAYIKKTLNPSWNAHFKIDGDTKNLEFEVYDHDTFTDDLIGYFKLGIEELPFDQEMFLTRTVLPRPNKKSPGGGEISFRIKRVSNLFSLSNRH